MDHSVFECYLQTLSLEVLVVLIEYLYLSLKPGLLKTRWTWGADFTPLLIRLLLIVEA